LLKHNGMNPMKWNRRMWKRPLFRSNCTSIG